MIVDWNLSTALCNVKQNKQTKEERNGKTLVKANNKKVSTSVALFCLWIKHNSNIWKGLTNET